jgi:hypothetical protein
VAVYVLWLGIRYRSPLLFTAANPGIPAGGVVGESKWDIMRAFSGPPAVLPTMAFIPGDATLDQRRAQVDSFMAEHGLGWPLVLKPDVGERGDGVAIVRSREQLHRLLEHARGSFLVQEYLPGREYGIFYHRKPDDAQGRIFSITDKQLPTVRGDGVSTLEALILRGERTVCTARMLLERHATRLWDVPAEGEVVALVDLGTHCRGAAFFDGTALKTAALEEAVDRVSRGFHGFYFGRYDVRAESDEALQQGRFKVIELNGVASEATSIYDPRHRLIDAYRILRQQWRIAFEIGAVNRAAGARPATLNELRALLRTHRAARRGHPAT